MEKIIRIITKRWKKGIVLSKEPLFFLDSSFGISTARELISVLNTPDDPEREMILEYLLFPDRDCRLAVEQVIEPAGFTKTLIDCIIEHLAHHHALIPVAHPHASDPVWVNISDDQIQTFVSRLYLDRRLDQQICTALEKRERYNMEYLMLSKYPVPHESAECVTRRLKNLSMIIHDILCIPSQPPRSLMKGEP